MTDREKEMLETLRGISEKLENREGESKDTKFSQLKEIAKYVLPFLALVVPFYFDTKNKDSNQDKQIESHETRITKLETLNEHRKDLEIDALKKELEAQKRKP